MGYMIRYDPENDKRYPEGRWNWLLSLVVWFSVIALFIAVIAGNSGDIQKFLIPGEPGVTRAAFSDLIRDVRGGEPVADAIASFCRQIIVQADVGL